MFEDVIIPQPSKTLGDALRKWTPNPSTLKWTTTLGGGFIRGPIEQAARLGIKIDKMAIDRFVENIYYDLDARGLFRANSDVLSPTHNPLANILAKDGTPNVYNTWDPMHFSVATLRDLYIECGYDWAGQQALRLVSSYYVNKQYPYLRCGDGDDPRKWYGSGGRTRTAARCLQALVQALDVLIASNASQTLIEQAYKLLAKHVTRISTAWPLTAQPKADHLPVPHVEVFMLGHLWEALRLAAIELYICDEATSDVAYKLSDMAQALIEKAELATVDPIWERGIFAYDLAIDASGNASIHEFAFHDKTKSVGGVNQWIYPALPSGPAKDALRADALKLNLPDAALKPLWWIDRIQETLP